MTDGSYLKKMLYLSSRFRYRDEIMHGDVQRHSAHQQKFKIWILDIQDGR